MVLVDANVLLYAVDEASPRHPAARTWLEGALAGREAVGFTWPVLLAFLRVATHPAIYAHPLTTGAAADQVERWLRAPGAVVVEPTARHLTLLRGLLEEAGTGGNLVNDAHLAALAIDSGATVVSFDRDFQRFAGVSSRVPA